MKPNLNEELKKAKAFLEMKGYNVAFIWIYGSQNYNLDMYTKEYTSDIDYKAVIVPTLDDLVFNSKPISTTLEYEGWQIDLKDIRVFTETLTKCNPAYIETLYTPYSIASLDYQKIIDERENLVKEMWVFLLKACYGMIKEKEKAFSHPYPSIKDKIDKYWYHPKQLHHIVRLYFLMKRYDENWIFNMANSRIDIKYLIDIKLWKYSLEEAKKVRDEYIRYSELIKVNHKVEPKFEAKERIINLSRELVKNSIEGKKQAWIKCPVCKNEFSPLPNM